MKTKHKPKSAGPSALHQTPACLSEAPSDWLRWSLNPCKPSCASLSVHREARRSLASRRRFLSGCLLITFSVYIRLPFIQGHSASPIHREPLRSSHLWGGRGPAGKSIPQGLSLWGIWQWSHPSKLSMLKAQGKASHKSMFLCEGGQRLKLTPADLGNKGIGTLCADPTLMLVVSLSIQTKLERQGKTLLSGETWLLSSPREKTKQVSQGGSQQEQHKGKMLASLPHAGSLERFW